MDCASLLEFVYAGNQLLRTQAQDQLIEDMLIQASSHVLEQVGEYRNRWIVAFLETGCSCLCLAVVGAPFDSCQRDRDDFGMSVVVEHQVCMIYQSSQNIL